VTTVAALARDGHVWMAADSLTPANRCRSSIFRRSTSSLTAMTRNEPDAADWIGAEEVRGSTPPWRSRDRRERQPMNWPTAAFGLGFLVFLGVVAVLCAGVARDWIAQ
jgi:hypothetical protein